MIRMPGAALETKSDNTGTLGVLGSLGLSDRMKKLVQAYLLTTASIEVVRRTHRRIRAQFVYTIAVPSTDDIYDVLHERILTLIPERRRRSIIVRARRSDEMVLESPGGPSRPSRRIRPRLYYDSTREQAITLDGQSVRVTVEQEEAAMATSDRYYSRRDRIVFTAHGDAARDAVMRLISEITDDLNEPTEPRFYMARYGGWERRDDLQPRKLGTVYLPAEQKARIVGDVRRFLDGRADYEQVGIPWHRGYLFHGPPGTGKTSLAKALATELQLDVYFLPISDLDLSADTQLLQLVASVPAGAMLLLEDIDILHSARERTDEARGVSMSGLLNALDGVSTPAGLIVVMTTNHREVLDPAIVRPGRVDLEEEIGFLDAEQLQQMMVGFFGSDRPVALPSESAVTSAEIAPTEITDVLKEYMGDSEAQWVAVQRLIIERVA